MTVFLLIRHALTESVKNQTLAGRLPDVFLNAEGKSQAEKLAAEISALPVRAIYSSPLERAIETAEILGRGLNLDVRIDENFGELNFGEWTGKSFGELETEENWRQFNGFRSNTRIPNGELMLEAQIRIVTGLEKLRERHPEEIIAVVSHSDIIKAAVAHFAGIHLDLFQRIEISPASLSIISLGDESVNIKLLNYTGELKKQII